MKVIEKAAPVDQTGDGSGQILLDGFKPDYDFTTVTATVQSGIERFLLYGQGNALSVKTLVKLTGLHPRQITEAVQHSRRRGVPVLSTTYPGGYFIAETEAEKQRCIRSLRHRAKEMYETLYCLERAQVVDRNSPQSAASCGELPRVAADGCKNHRARE